jgi:MHS family alpha-ketoglutarate permease-like MFS transporter
VRALGVGLGNAIANALFAGTAEYVALGLKSIDHEEVFYSYVPALMAVVFLVSLTLPRRPSHLREEP